MNQVDSLKTQCCKSIVNDDNFNMLQPIVDILPMEILEHWFALFDEFQCRRFYRSTLSETTSEMLYVKMYRKSYQNKIDNALPKSLVFPQGFELSLPWKRRLASILEKPKEEQFSLLLEICAKVPHIVHVLHLFDDQPEDARLARFSRFTKIRCLSLKTEGDVEVNKLFRLAENWKMLQKIKLTITHEETPLWQSLKQFLELKLQKNENVHVSFAGEIFTQHRKFIVNLFSFLGNSIHGMSGMTLRFPFNANIQRNWLIEYSKVQCIRKLKFKGWYHNSAYLLDIVRNAPIHTSDDNTVSKLHLHYIELPRDNYIAFQHWRFSRIEYFNMTNVNMGYTGATLLATFATFWPFLKRFILRCCSIPSSGFSKLLPAMVCGRGCEHLMELDFGKNVFYDTSMKAFLTFLNKDHVKKLKSMRLFEYYFPTPLLPPQLITGLQKIPLVHLDMSEIILELDQLYQLLNTLLIKIDNQLREITFLVPSWFSTIRDQHQINLKTLGEIYKLSPLQSNLGKNIEQEELLIEREEKFIKLVINRTYEN